MSWLEESKEYLDNLYERYHFLEYKEVVVDGFVLNDDIDFRIDKNWAYKKYDEFNTKYFKGTLDEVTKDWFTFSYESYYRGECVNSFASNNGAIDLITKQMKLSKYRYYTEKEYCETLLHEMIHIYLNKLHLFRDSAFHENGFIEKMNEINSCGWDVKTYTIATNKVSKTSLRKISKSIIVIYSDDLGNAYGFKANPKTLPDVRDYLEEHNYKHYIFKVRNGALTRSFPYVDDFKDNIERGIPFLPLSKEQIIGIANKVKKDNLQESEEKKKNEYPQDFIDMLHQLEEWGIEVNSIQKENGQYKAIVLQH